MLPFRYDSRDLIADIGGYLGLLLGASILSMYDKACDFIKRVKQDKTCGCYTF